MRLYWHLGMWIFVNLLFTFKYLSRAGNWAPLLAILTITFAAALTFWITGKTRTDTQRNTLTWLSSTLFVATALTGFILIPVELIRVDRYEMIRLFWENAFSGINPYTPRVLGVSNVPSQFPVYFLLALPFHLIGEIGWIPVLSVLSLAWLLNKSSAFGSRNTASIICLFLLSPALWWEIICRSTIFANSVLILFASLPLLMSPEKTLGKRSQLFLGLATATRSVAFLVTFPILLNRIYLSPKRWIIPSATVLGVSISAILPLFLPFFHDWGPFKVNGLFLPTWVMAVVALLTCVASFRIRDMKSVLAVSVIALDLFVVLYAGRILLSEGWNSSFFGSAVDISYFLLSAPFHLYLLFNAPDGRESL